MLLWTVTACGFATAPPGSDSTPKAACTDAPPATIRQYIETHHPDITELRDISTCGQLVAEGFCQLDEVKSACCSCATDFTVKSEIFGLEPLALLLAQILANKSPPPPPPLPPGGCPITIRPSSRHASKGDDPNGFDVTITGHRFDTQINCTTDTPLEYEVMYGTPVPVASSAGFTTRLLFYY